MQKFRVVLVISCFILVGYFALLGGIFYVEMSDNLNMETGQNTMMGELKILIGVLTAAVSQVLNYWFSSGLQTVKKSDSVPIRNK